MSIHVFDSRGNTIRGNKISGIILDPLLDSDAGIVIENGSRDNVLENNDVSDTGDAGIVIHQGSHGNIVRGGILVRNGDAGVIVQDSDRIEIDGVLSHQQSDGGVVLSNSSNSDRQEQRAGLQPVGRRRLGHEQLLVENNDVSHSLQAGIELGDGVGMIVRNNIASNNGGSGISIEGATFDANGVAVGGALVEGNVAHENAESGIAVATSRHTIRNNTATRMPTTASRPARSRCRRAARPEPQHRRRRQQGRRQPRRSASARTAGRDPVRRRRVRTNDIGVMSPEDLDGARDEFLTTPPLGRQRHGSLHLHGRRRLPER